MITRNNVIVLFVIILFLAEIVKGVAQPCSPTTGTAKPNTIEYVLNPLKNRTTKPTAAQMDNTVSLDKVLQPGNDETRFSENDGGEVEGYVVLVKMAGAETCNCKKTAKKHKDVHIEIAKNQGETNKAKLMVVEITPKIRATIGDAWTYDKLKKLKGHKVRFKGWMFWDKMHWNVAKNTAPSGNTIHRATAWEIHPVTAWTQLD